MGHSYEYCVVHKGDSLDIDGLTILSCRTGCTATLGMNYCKDHVLKCSVHGGIDFKFL